MSGDRQNLNIFLRKKLLDELDKYLPKDDKAVSSIDADQWAQEAVLRLIGDIENENIELNAGVEKDVTIRIKDNSHRHTTSNITDFAEKVQDSLVNAFQSMDPGQFTITYSDSENKFKFDLKQGLNSGLDADSVRGVAGNKLVTVDNVSARVLESASRGWYKTRSSGNGGALRWTRIASHSGGSPASMICTIRGTRSGQHTVATFMVSCSYGQSPRLTLLNNSQYGSQGIHKIRLEYNGTYDAYRVYVQGDADAYIYSVTNAIGFSDDYLNNASPANKAVTLDITKTDKAMDIMGAKYYQNGQSLDSLYLAVGGTAKNSEEVGGFTLAQLRNASNLNAGTLAAARLPAASDKTQGAVKLSSSYTSNSTTVAATSNAVRIAYNKGNHSHPYINETATLFVVQDGDGTNRSMQLGKYLKFREGGNIDINFTDTTPGTAGDPYDLTMSVPNATTSVRGAVRLSDSVTSTSSTIAATSKAVKAAYDRAGNTASKNTYGSNARGHWWKCGSTGVMIQWGYIASDAKTKHADWPVNFPGNCHNVQLTDYYQSGSGGGTQYNATMWRWPHKAGCWLTLNTSQWYVFYIAIGK